MLEVKPLEIESPELTPIQKVIKADNFEKLSREAKEIIWIIIKSPNEIFEILPSGRSKTKKITESKIKSFLSIKWKSTPKWLRENLINEVIWEIKEWIKTL